MSYDKIIKTMKVGVMGPNYPVPSDVKEEDRIEWLFKRSHEMGCTTIDYAFPFEDTDAGVAELKRLMETYKIEPDMRAPRGLFKIYGCGEESEQVKKELKSRCDSMHKLGLNIMRSGYGQNTIAVSRFSHDISVKDHMQKLIDNLKEAAKILEEEEIYLAIENHCDFTAKEMVEIFDAVDSPYVGCALDTGNGIIVFSDPNEEYKILAPYTITTHIKDMGIMQDPENNSVGTHVPFTACKTMMGEGIVDIEDAIETMARKSKHAVGLRLIVETGAMTWSPQFNHLSKEERVEITRTWYDGYVEKLLEFIDR